MDKDVEALCERLTNYRSHNGWGDTCHHEICDEAAAMLKALVEENERLSQAPHVSGYVSLDQFDAAEARAIAAESKAEALRNMLRPFALAAQYWKACHDTQQITYRDHSIEVGDLRRAAAGYYTTLSAHKGDAK